MWISMYRGDSYSIWLDSKGIQGIRSRACVCVCVCVRVCVCVCVSVWLANANFTGNTSLDLEMDVLYNIIIKLTGGGGGGDTYSLLWLVSSQMTALLQLIHIVTQRAYMINNNDKISSSYLKRVVKIIFTYFSWIDITLQLTASHPSSCTDIVWVLSP